MASDLGYMEPGEMDDEPSPWDGVPDEILGSVLGLLRTLDLFSARCVCRRWRDLASSRAAWRRRTLPYWVPVDLALRVAPCVAWLSNSAFPFREALATTRCVVQDKIKANLNRFNQLDLNVRVVSNQLQLGVFKRLVLDFYSCQLTPSLGHVSEAEKAARLSRVLELMAQVLASDHLRSLKLNEFQWTAADMPPASEVLPPNPGRASLRRLAVDGYFPKPLLDFLLVKHAATLEAVSLRHCHADAALLAGVVGLRDLGAYLVPALTKLLPQAGRLECLALYKNKDRNVKDACAAHAAGRQLLSLAVRLDELQLFDFHLDESLELVVAAVAAAAPGGSALKTLGLEAPEEIDGSVLSLKLLRPLIQVLPSLPRLADLRLGVVAPPALFAELTPESVPSLVDLLVYGPWRHCVHAWLHDFGVLAAMRRLPRLHVRAAPGLLRFCRRSSLPNGAERCEHCRQPCHDNFDSDDPPDTFYTHDEDTACASRSHTDGRPPARV